MGTGWVILHALFADNERVVWGVDHLENASMALVQALKRERPDLARRYYFAIGDLETQVSLDGVHVVFSFGAAFLPAVVENLFRLFEKTKTLHDIFWVTTSKKKDSLSAILSRWMETWGARNIDAYARGS